MYSVDIVREVCKPYATMEDLLIMKIAQGETNNIIKEIH